PFCGIPAAFGAGGSPACEREGLEESAHMKLTGIGLYSFPEASRLARVPTRDLRRWLCGYSYRGRKDGALMLVPPLWRTRLADEANIVISFHELLEARCVKAFRQHGVKLQTIRAVRQRACDVLGTASPFASGRFLAEAPAIFAGVMPETGDAALQKII